MNKTASDWIDEGKSHHANAMYDDAIKCFDQAISLDPNNAVAYAGKGKTLYADTKFPESAENFQKSLDLGQRDHLNYEYLGYIYVFKIRKREEAIRVFDEGLTLYPQNYNMICNKANALMTLGKTQEAKVNFLIFVNEGKGSGEACAMIGSFLVDEGKHEEALSYFNKGLELDASNFKCKFLKANLLLDQGKTDEAITIYNQILAGTPNHALCNLQMGRIHAKLGNSEESKKYYEKGAYYDACVSADICSKGQCLNMIGRTEQAMDCFKEAQNLFEHGAEVYGPWFERNMKVALKAVLEIEEVAKKVESEIAQYDQDSALVQKFKADIKLLQKKKVDAQNMVMEQATKNENDEKPTDLNYLEQIKGEFNEQLTELKKQLSHTQGEDQFGVQNLEKNTNESSEEKKTSKSASAWINEGKSHHSKKMYGDAIKCFDQAISLDPNNAAAYAEKGKTLYADAKFLESAESFQKSLDLGQKDHLNYEYLGYIYVFKIRKREEAIRVFDEGLILYPQNYNMICNKANALMTLGKTQEAKENFMIFVNEGKGSGEACAMIGSFLVDEGKHEEALSYFNKGLGLDSSNFKCKFLKANLLLDQGKTDEAIAIYNQVLAGTPNHALCNLQMARVHAKFRNSEEAKKYYEKGAQYDACVSADICSKGQCLNMIGETQEAMNCFKQAQNLFEHGAEVYGPWFERNMTVALKAVLESEEVAKKVESEVAQCDQDSALVQKFKANIKLLQKKKVNAQNQVIEQASKNENDDKTHDLNHLDQIKEEFNEQLTELKKQLSDVQVEK